MSESIPSLDQKRILVIDDEQRMADSIQALLANEDYHVDLAYTGEEGIKQLEEGDYQVVISDIRMPEADGYQVLRVVEDKKPHVLVILITGHASIDSVLEALHHQAFDYLQKPFEFDDLKACVERAFRKIAKDRMREDMISMITHDLKIPLSSVVGFSSLIYDEGGNLHPRAPDFVRNIQLNAEKVRSLIDNFLTSSKIESGKLEVIRSEIHLNTMVGDVLKIMAMDVERQGQSLDTSLDAGDAIVLGDENLLSRALGNIINNAIKYTPQAGTIRIITETLDTENSPLNKPAAVIRVANTGAGIPSDELEAVFSKFRRLDNIRGIEGSGLGLYVVKFVVEHHNGIVEVESEPNVWTTFSLILPAKAS